MLLWGGKFNHDWTKPFPFGDVEAANGDTSIGIVKRGNSGLTKNEIFFNLMKKKGDPFYLYYQTIASTQKFFPKRASIFMTPNCHVVLG